jgi:hypothetical protein
MIEGGKRSEGDRISSEGKQKMIRGGRRDYLIIGRTGEGPRGTRGSSYNRANSEGQRVSEESKSRPIDIGCPGILSKPVIEVVRDVRTRLSPRFVLLRKKG